MITFKDFIFEAKQVGIIFHFTTLPSLNDMIDQPDPFLINASKNKETFSTSRNPNLDKNPHFIECRAVIILDGNKMSEQHKIRPVAGFASDQSGVLDIHSTYSRVKRSKGEAEEAVIKHPINIKKYVKHIHIKPSRHDKELYSAVISKLDGFKISHSYGEEIPKSVLQ